MTGGESGGCPGLGATWGPEAPGGCSARITGSWWVSVPSHVDDGVPGRCPHGFTYQPGG